MIEEDYIVVNNDGIEIDEDIEIIQTEEIEESKRIYTMQDTTKKYEKIVRGYASALSSKKKGLNEGAKICLEEYLQYFCDIISSPEMQENDVFIFGLSHSSPAEPLTLLCYSANKASLQRQVQTNNDFLLSRINHFLGERTEIIFIGHSYGGTIAEYLSANVIAAKLQALMHTRETDNISKLRKINMELYQSAGVSRNKAVEAKQHLMDIKNIENDFKVSSHIYMCTNDWMCNRGFHLYVGSNNEVAEIYIDVRNYYACSAEYGVIFRLTEEYKSFKLSKLLSNEALYSSVKWLFALRSSYVFMNYFAPAAASVLLSASVTGPFAATALLLGFKYIEAQESQKVSFNFHDDYESPNHQHGFVENAAHHGVYSNYNELGRKKIKSLCNHA